MSPKSEFQKNQVAASDHQKLVSDPRVTDALLVAYNELCWTLPDSEHPQQSWAANARRHGAKQFIEIFLGLGTPTAPLKRPTSGKLESEDGQSSTRSRKSGAE